MNADAGVVARRRPYATEVPALITDDLSDVVAQNPLNVALLGPISTEEGRRRTGVTIAIAHESQDRAAPRVPQGHEYRRTQTHVRGFDQRAYLRK